MEINIFSFSNIFRPYWTGKTTEMQKYHSLVMSVNLLAFLWKNSMTRTVNELLIVGTTTKKSAKSQTQWGLWCRRELHLKRKTVELALINVSDTNNLRARIFDKHAKVFIT